MLRSVNRLAGQSRVFFVTAAVLTVMAVGVIDYLTRSEFSLSVFYLLALGVAAWFVGRWFAYFISVFSVAVSLAGDLAAGSRYPSFFVPLWNASIVLTFYLIVTSLLMRVSRQAEGLEAQVRERTAGLTQQMA